MADSEPAPFRVEYSFTTETRERLSVSTNRPLDHRELKKLIRVLHVMHDLMSKPERDEPGEASDG